MPHEKLNVAAQGMLDAYNALLDTRGYMADAAQMAAATALQSLYTNLLSFKVHRSSTFKRLLSPPKPPKGVYFWGGVGRGKSFLMDCFYDSVPYRRKRRIHFHAFMQQIHRDLEKYKGEPDPMLRLAEAIAKTRGVKGVTGEMTLDNPERTPKKQLVVVKMDNGFKFVKAVSPE